MNPTHLEGSYNIALIVLSFMIAVMASYTALDMARRVKMAEGWRSTAWLISGATAMGVGIWGMHFIAMLALDLTVPVTYRLLHVGVSILVAILASLGGLYAGSRSAFSWKRILIGAGFMGAAIAGMHYIGMAAMVGVATQYSPSLVGLSILIAIAASLSALLLSFRFGDDHPLFLHWAKLGSGVIMGGAIVGMHYTGMAAASFTPAYSETGSSIVTTDRSVLAVYVTIATVMVQQIVLIGSYMADKRLAEQIAFNGSILESAIDCILLVDAEGRVTEFNPSAEAAFGISRARALYRGLEQFIVFPEPAKAGRTVEFLVQTSSGEGERRFETYGVHADGYDFPIEVTVSRVRLQGRPLYTVYIRDITVRRQTEAALKESEERYRRLVDSSPEAIFAHRDGIVLFANEATVRLTGVPDSTYLVGRSLYDWVEEGRRDEIGTWLRAIENAEDEAGPIEIRIRGFDGEPVDIEANSIRVRDNGKSFILTIARNVTEKKRLEQSVQQMAYYDGLTGLPNRNLLGELVMSSLETARSYELLVAVMFIDLDGFKHVNDSFGHAVGDMLLKELSQRLAQSVRETDTVSRLGGDEFIVLLPNTTREQAETAAQRMMANIAIPFRYREQSTFVTASIGIAMYPDDGDSAEQLIKHADQAMYEAKEQGKNGYRFFSAR